MSRRCLDGAATALLALLAAAAGAQSLYFEGGLSVARGDYTYAQTTSSGGASAGLAWSSRRFTVRATLPYVVRDTRLVLAPDGTLPTDPALGEGGYEGSLADPLLHVYGEVFQSARTAVGLSVSLKIPLVQAGDFATGQWDFGGAASLSRFLGTATLLGLDVGYWHLGDIPELPLQDTVSGTLTIGHSLGRSWTASASLAGARSAMAGYDDLWWAGLLVGRSFGRGFAGLSTSVGLSDGAADFTLGFVWRAPLGGSGTMRP